MKEQSPPPDPDDETEANRKPPGCHLHDEKVADDGSSAAALLNSWVAKWVDALATLPKTPGEPKGPGPDIDTQQLKNGDTQQTVILSNGTVVTIISGPRYWDTSSLIYGPPSAPASLTYGPPATAIGGLASLAASPINENPKFSDNWSLQNSSQGFSRVSSVTIQSPALPAGLKITIPIP